MMKEKSFKGICKHPGNSVKISSSEGWRCPSLNQTPARVGRYGEVYVVSVQKNKFRRHQTGSR